MGNVVKQCHKADGRSHALRGMSCQNEKRFRSWGLSSKFSMLCGSSPTWLLAIATSAPKLRHELSLMLTVLKTVQMFVSRYHVYNFVHPRQK